jgi:hypothetical protein
MQVVLVTFHAPRDRSGAALDQPGELDAAGIRRLGPQTRGQSAARRTGPGEGVEIDIAGKDGAELEPRLRFARSARSGLLGGLAVMITAGGIGAHEIVLGGHVSQDTSPLQEVSPAPRWGGQGPGPSAAAGRSASAT